MLAVEPCYVAGLGQELADKTLLPTTPDFNAHLFERAERCGRRQLRSCGTTSLPTPPPVHLISYPAVHKYFETTDLPTSSSSWMLECEIPTTDEIIQSNEGDGQVNLPINEIDGPWPSVENYLAAHYELLRADSILPLRGAVKAVRNRPLEPEASYGGSIGIYENVRITAVTLSTRGVAVRVAFSLARTGKRIHWEQSKRLISGSLVALTPKKDMFQRQCVVAVVAARPVSALMQNPPEIDLFFARAVEIELDPQVEWVMVEDRSSFFEAGRHTLLALQKLATEPFPLQEHLVDVNVAIDAPDYIRRNPCLDLRAITPVQTEEFDNVDVLHDWPEHMETSLDKSQLSALRRILTKRLPIVQGPPGTGKTHVSVEALKVLISNMGPGDPPIIVTCQTNHALDQLLRHVATFESNFVRIGGRSKDQGVIKSRTLFEVRKTLPFRSGGGKSLAIKRMAELTKLMQVLLSPLSLRKEPLDLYLFQRLGLVTQTQCDSLQKEDHHWVEHDQGPQTSDPLQRWMGKNLVPAFHGVRLDEFGVEYEEADIEFEQLKDMEAEACAQDDDFETLKGTTVSIADNFTGDAPPNVTDQKIKELLQNDDLWKIRSEFRGAVYCYWQREAKKAILTSFRIEAAKFNELAQKRKIGGWEHDACLLKEQKVIGMTTTGFSKYRALISAILPRIVLIEEAAETLEPPVIAACVPSLEQLILVGDHKQLRPHCQVRHLEGDPFNFNVSLFERLVSNNAEFSTLKRQRRMIPEIRRLLRPIYDDIIRDHNHVKDPDNRPPVAGMGGTNSYFFTHEWPEFRDEHMSTCNFREAVMIAGFVNYLVLNGEGTGKITVLTFYNGQRKLLNQQLRQYPDLEGSAINVVTVDSYQGEENDIVLLSLVRSNDNSQIGFLKNDNRVCVALSRAKRGFYLFGNGELLASESETWAKVIDIIAGKRGERPPCGAKRRIGYQLPLTCARHNREMCILEPEDWNGIAGAGCEEKCGGVLPCGHPCLLTCHPYEHDVVNCQNQCERKLQCGHGCRSLCYETCCCGTCGGMSTNHDNTQSAWLNIDRLTLQRSPRPKSTENPVSSEPTSGFVPVAMRGQEVQDENHNSAIQASRAIGIPGQNPKGASEWFQEKLSPPNTNVDPLVEARAEAKAWSLPKPSRVIESVYVNKSTGSKFTESFVSTAGSGRAISLKPKTNEPSWKPPLGENLIGEEFIVRQMPHNPPVSSSGTQDCEFKYAEADYMKPSGVFHKGRVIHHNGHGSRVKNLLD